MVNYECYRCGYTNNNKSNIIRHIGRKRICTSYINDINIDDCKEYILNGLTYEKYLNLNKNKNEHSMSQNEHSMSQNEQFIIDDNNKCLYCNKIYKHVQSLNRHFKKCYEKHKSDEANRSMTELVTILNSQINDFKKALDKKDKQIDELIKKAGINNSTITQNIQNNIKVLAYKNTDMSKLTDKDILKCMNHSNMCVPHLIKMIHLDPEKPENHNVYISNLPQACLGRPSLWKNGYIMVYDGTKWDTLNRDEIIVDMIDDTQGLMEERIENWIERGEKYPTIMKKFERYIEKKENNKVINKIKEEIRLMLFNNRTLIKHKEIE